MSMVDGIIFARRSLFVSANPVSMGHCLWFERDGVWSVFYDFFFFFFFFFFFHFPTFSFTYDSLKILFSFPFYLLSSRLVIY